MTDVFLSYAREDQARIAPLAAVLTAAGFNVWWDRHLTGGADFSRATEEQLNRAQIIVVAWSKAAIESMWVADEATVGRDKGNLIPIVLDGSPPRIGFRQIQTIDFSNWRGATAETPAAALLEALRARLGAVPKPQAPSAQPKARWSLVAAAVLLAAIGLAALSAMNHRSDPHEVAPVKQGAVAAIDDPALSVLEALAVESEGKGDLRAASAAYTRYAARALVSDRARGLAARRKAFDLDPESISALQGLFYDTFLNKGGVEARALGESVLTRLDLSPRVRAFTLALLGTVDLDMFGDVASAEQRLALLREMDAASDDESIGYATLWLDSVLDGRLGRFQSALEKGELTEQLYLSMPPDVPRNGEVQLVLAKFSSGDWEGALATGTKVIERRRRNGEFLAWPILDTVCRAALFLDRPDGDAGACAMVSGRGARDSNAQGKLVAAIQAALEGDYSAARGDLAAAAAMSTPAVSTSQPQHSVFHMQILQAEAYIAVRSGDFETARRLVAESMTPRNTNPVGRSSENHIRASSARLLAMEMLRSGAIEGGCAEAARAAEFYRQMNAAAGVAAVETLARGAGC